MDEKDNRGEVTESGTENVVWPVSEAGTGTKGVTVEGIGAATEACTGMRIGGGSGASTETNSGASTGTGAEASTGTGPGAGTGTGSGASTGADTEAGTGAGDVLAAWWRAARRRFLSFSAGPRCRGRRRRGEGAGGREGKGEEGKEKGAPG